MKLNLRKPVGATVVEYVIMLILVGLVIMGIMKVFGGTISKKVEMAQSGVQRLDKRRGQESFGSGRSEKSVGGSEASSENDKGSKDKQKSGSKSDGFDEGEDRGNGGGAIADGVAVKKKKGPGINPIVLLIALALVGLLIYVMGAKKKG